MKINLEHYEQINIYNESGVIFSTIRGGLERVNINNDKCNTFHNNKVTEIDIHVDNIRNALKLNLNKKDVFAIKYIPDNRYHVRNGKALYIYTDYISVKNIGEYLSMEHNGEKNFLTLYQFSFNTIQTVKEPTIERIICDNYILKNGEAFGSHYGLDKEHAVISTFDNSGSPLRIRANKPIEKGILKKYLENVQYYNFIVQSDYYTKTEKDPARVEREKIADIINDCLNNKTLSHYDIEKILKKLNITIKEG